MFKVVTAFALFAVAVYGQGTGANVGIKPQIAESAVTAFGEYKSPLIFDGFLFINGRYVKPPYSVQYRGNAVMINGILIDRPIRWFGDDSDLTAQPAVSSATQTDVAIRSESAPREVAVVEVVSETKPKVAVKAAAGSDEFLLFDDEPSKPKAIVAEPVAVVPKVAAKAAAGNDEFLLFDDEAPKKTAAKPVAVSVAEPVASGSAPAATVSTIASDSGTVAVSLDAEARQKIDALMQNKAALKQLRENMLLVAKTYEEYLYYGNFLFVGRTHSRLTGPYVSARALIEALPMAMRMSTSGEDLKNKLEKQNVFFLDSLVCDALYANRLTFLEIEDRRKAMQTAIPPPKRK